MSLIPGSGKSPGEGNGHPLQFYCLENPMDRRAWQATVHGFSQIRHDLATKLPYMCVYVCVKKYSFYLTSFHS